MLKKISRDAPHAGGKCCRAWITGRLNYQVPHLRFATGWPPAGYRSDGDGYLLINLDETIANTIEWRLIFTVVMLNKISSGALPARSSQVIWRR
jgi:hypothetical protein